MALDARDRSEIYEKLIPSLGEHHANVLMSQFPSVEADELVTKQFLRAELSELRSELRGEMGSLRSELRGEIGQLRGEMGELRTELLGDTAQLRGELRGEIGELRVEMAERFHRQTVWLGSALAGSTALLATMVGLFS